MTMIDRTRAERDAAKGSRVAAVALMAAAGETGEWPQAFVDTAVRQYALPTIDADDVDRVIKGLMADHDAVTARCGIRMLDGQWVVVAVLDEGLPTAQPFVVDVNGERVTDTAREAELVRKGLLVGHDDA